jgi:hypothetical protein
VRWVLQEMCEDSSWIGKAPAISNRWYWYLVWIFPVFKRHGQVFYVSGSHLLHSLSATTQTGLQRLPLLTYVALVTLFTVIATYIPGSWICKFGLIIITSMR